MNQYIALNLSKVRLLVVSLLCWQVLAFASITTQVSQSTVQLSDTFRLVFTIEAPIPDSIPDLTPLLKDFTIVGTERSMAYSIVNGEKHSVNQWIILLAPQKIGVFPIPSIKIGQQETTPSRIEVVKDTAGAQDEKNDLSDEEDVILKTELSSPSVFVNQQLIYTVKLYNHQRLLDADYQPPQIEDALLIPLGDARHYQTMMNNRNYAVEEQQYAIFPQKSGQLTLTGPSFRALVFGTVPKRINEKAKARKITVKAIPSHYTGKYWLPAKQLSLTEVYDQTDTTIKEGGTLTRTITLQAAGVPAQLLPNLEFANSSQFNRYPEKPVQKNSLRQGDLVGRTDTKITYIMNHAGKVTIPPLHVTWFDTTLGKEMSASLPARTIAVIPKSTALSSTPKIASAPTLNARVKLPKKQLMAIKVGLLDRLVWWFMGGFIVIALIGLFWWWRKMPMWVRFKHQRKLLKALHQACMNNVPKTARDNLLSWANEHWPNHHVLNLHHMARLIHDTALKKQLFILSQALYSQENHVVWPGDELWRRLSIYLRQKSKSKTKAAMLPPINPNSG